MQFTIEFDSEGRYATTRAWESASVEELREFTAALTMHPQWRSGLPLIIDLRELDTTRLTREEIREMADSIVDFNEAMGDGKTALVVSGDLVFGMARMWSSYAEDHAIRNHGVFRTMDEAIAWILK